MSSGIFAANIGAPEGPVTLPDGSMYVTEMSNTTLNVTRLDARGERHVIKHTGGRPNGLAIDVMIPNHETPEGIELGNQIAGFALANAKRWGINHVIWRQKIYPGVGAGSWTADYGNETANHYDHVHIATDGGGYPTGHEIYYIASMTPAP